MIESMGFAKRLFKVGNNLRENFRMVNRKERELMSDKMNLMKEIGLMVLSMDMEYGKRVVHIMKENGNSEK